MNVRRGGGIVVGEVNKKLHVRLFMNNNFFLDFIIGKSI